MIKSLKNQNTIIIKSGLTTTFFCIFAKKEVEMTNVTVSVSRDNDLEEITIGIVMTVNEKEVTNSTLTLRSWSPEYSRFDKMTDQQIEDEIIAKMMPHEELL